MTSNSKRYRVTISDTIKGETIADLESDIFIGAIHTQDADGEDATAITCCMDGSKLSLLHCLIKLRAKIDKLAEIYGLQGRKAELIEYLTSTDDIDEAELRKIEEDIGAYDYE